jgi:hypothetical protein
MKYLSSFKIYEKRVSKDERIQIYRDKDYVVVLPLTFEASCKYGADTRWCTSALSNSFLWTEDNDRIPNRNQNDILLIYIIRRNYKMTEENERLSEEYYFLSNEVDNGEATEEQRERMLELEEDDNYNYLDLSKIAITFNKKNKQIGIWSGNNIDMEQLYFNNLYDLERIGIPEKVLDAIYNYTQDQYGKYNENQKGFVLSEKSYKDFYDKVLKLNGDDKETSFALSILTTVKENNYFITFKQYDAVKNVIEGNLKFKEKTKGIEIPYSTLDNYYMKLNPSTYHRKLINNLKKKKPNIDGKIEISKKQYLMLQKLKKGL